MKRHLGKLLPKSSRFAATAMKFATYPAFLAWQASHPIPTPILGGAREKRNNLFHQVAEGQGLFDGPLRYFEFGVHKGESLKWWSQHNSHPESRFFGFDSFEGLPEDWSADKPAGYFSTDSKIPLNPDSRVEFVRGWFHQTLFHYLDQLKTDNRIVVHLDADLYRSTIFPLLSVGPWLKERDILIFDEFLDSSHEFRAFIDAQAIFGWEIEFLGATEGYAQVAFKLEATEPGN